MTAQDDIATERLAGKLAFLASIPPSMTRDRSVAGRTALVRRLGAVCRAERARGNNNHWTYNANRHQELYAIYIKERTDLLDWLMGA